LPAKAVKTIASVGKTHAALRAFLHSVHLPRGRPSAPRNGAETVNATRYLPFVGRLLIGLPFMASGLSKVANYDGTIALIESSTLPLPPPLAYAGAITVEVGCGLLIILGYQTRVVAIVFALFCLATAVFFHTNFADPNQTFHFIKNLVMTGGLLQIVANGAGVISIDNRIFKSRAQTGRAKLGSWLNPEAL
jgi:putative oxidoreductase